MTDPRDADANPPSSPPCLAHEIDPFYAGPATADPQTVTDVARWRRAARAMLLAARKERSAADLAARTARIAAHLDAVLNTVSGGARGRVLSAYWPIKGEPDLRPLMVRLHAAGVVIALPVVETKAAPLVFRLWTPETKMVRGDWNIPVPPADAPALIPDIALAPLVGWDGAGFRLGYGGGYFDRTLAALTPRPVTIGIGFAAARVATIYPQAWDIRLGTILTEEGVMVGPRDL